MKKRNIILATAFCAVGFTVGAAASGLVQKVESELRPDFTVVIDGQERTFKNVDGETVYPMLYNGTTYLPVRAIGEIMGKTVYWYEDEKRIELKDSNSTVTDADVIISGSSGGSSSSGSIQTSDEDKITLEQVKKIAIEKAGLDADTQVTFTEIDLDNEKGRRKYEIEFYYNGTKYSADISTADGSVLSWDVEKKTNNGNGNKNDNNGNNASSTNQQSNGIGVEKAKQIALDKSGLSESDVTFKKAEYEFDDGVWIYDIEFYQGRTEYSAEILASDGSIVAWEVDND